MIGFAPVQPHHQDGASAAFTAAQVAVACFGEAGMHAHPGCSAHQPLAAGLFGIASDAATVPLRCYATGRA